MNFMLLNIQEYVDVYSQDSLDSALRVGVWRGQEVNIIEGSRGQSVVLWDVRVLGLAIRVILVIPLDFLLLYQSIVDDFCQSYTV